jgi:hypothetical protein
MWAEQGNAGRPPLSDGVYMFFLTRQRGLAAETIDLSVSESRVAAVLSIGAGGQLQLLV